jgi:hypothetical protein
MTAIIAQTTTEAAFDLEIGDVEVDIPEIDDIAAATTRLGSPVPPCTACTCRAIYCS